MPAPVVVALDGQFIEAVRCHLLARGAAVTTEQVTEALTAAARFEDATPQPDLFGGAP